MCDDDGENWIDRGGGVGVNCAGMISRAWGVDGCWSGAGSNSRWRVLRAIRERDGKAESDHRSRRDDVETWRWLPGVYWPPSQHPRLPLRCRPASGLCRELFFVGLRLCAWGSFLRLGKPPFSPPRDPRCRPQPAIMSLNIPNAPNAGLFKGGYNKYVRHCCFSLSLPRCPAMARSSSGAPLLSHPPHTLAL